MGASGGMTFCGPFQPAGRMSDSKGLMNDKLGGNWQEAVAA